MTFSLTLHRNGKTEQMQIYAPDFSKASDSADQIARYGNADRFDLHPVNREAA